MIVNEKTQFDDAILDDITFTKFLGKFTNMVPKRIGSKKVVKVKLEKRKIPQDIIEYLLEISKFH